MKKKTSLSKFLVAFTTFMLIIAPATMGFAALKTIENQRGNVGPLAWELGIRSYEVSSNNDTITINYTHKNKSLEGTLYTNSNNVWDKYAVKFLVNSNLISVDWDAMIGKLVLDFGKGEPIIFVFNEDADRWEGNNKNAFKTFDNYSNELRLMLAILNDFTPAVSTSIDSEDSSLSTMQSICPDYNNMKQGGPVYNNYRSIACQEAHQDCAYKCSNAYCYGCYSYVGTCDCVCLGGDMFCRCVRFGYPCTAC